MLEKTSGEIFSIYYIKHNNDYRNKNLFKVNDQSLNSNIDEIRKNIGYCT